MTSFPLFSFSLYVLLVINQWETSSQSLKVGIRIKERKKNSKLSWLSTTIRSNCVTRKEPSGTSPLEVFGSLFPLSLSIEAWACPWKREGAWHFPWSLFYGGSSFLTSYDLIYGLSELPTDAITYRWPRRSISARLNHDPPFPGPL